MASKKGAKKRAVRAPAKAARSVLVTRTRTAPKDLYRYAEDYARRNHVAFGAGADSVMRRAAQRAMLEIDEAEESRARRATAERNFRKVIDAMVKARKTIPGYATAHGNTIGEETFGAAMRKLCPIWPFC